YMREFDHNSLPLDGVPALPPGAPAVKAEEGGGKKRGVIVRRHGCSKDIQALWLKTRDVVPDNDDELLRKLIANGVEGYSEASARKKNARKNMMSKADLAKQPKKKHRNYIQKNQRTTNSHLLGTELGDILMSTQHQVRRAGQEEAARKAAAR
ncbi:hypothetical protein TeGR_g3041, partial [Tetraparma gracilis]